MCLELVIIVGIVKVILGNYLVDWDVLIVNYECICELIVDIIFGFVDFNCCVCYFGGFYFGNFVGE